MQSTLGYAVFICSSCGRYLIAKTGQKSKRCNYCECMIELSKTKKVASADSAREASKIMRELKMQHGK